MAQKDNPAIVRLPECTGSLIAADRVLTAAHCLHSIQPGSTVLRIASRLYRVMRWARDPRYRYEQHLYTDPTPYAPPYDAAIVALDRPVSGVVPLPMRSTPVPADQVARTIGYGSNQDESGGSFGTLRAASVITRSDRRCQAAIKRADSTQAKLYVPGANVCVQDADGQAPYRSACSGDSGSPLLVAGPNRLEIAAIDAWSVACGHRHNDPSVYMTITSVRDFLASPSPPWAPEPIGAPSIQGIPAPGRQLTCVEPAWARQPPSRVRFGWYLPRSSPSGKTYTVRSKDAGAAIRCYVAASIVGGGTLSYPSPSVAVPGT